MLTTLRTLMNRRRDEDARVARFVHAIRLSGRYAVDDTWELRHVPDDGRLSYTRVLVPASR